MDLSFLDDTRFGLPESFGGHNFMIPSFKTSQNSNQMDLSPHLSGGQLKSDGFCFKLAQTQDPHNFVKYMKQDSATKAMTDFKKGTTTLAFEFNGGVIVAVDSRATMGAFISSHTVRKVIEVNNFLLGTMAGGAADCSFWERDLARQCRLFELRNNQRITVAGASKLLSSIFYHYRGYGLSCGTMVAGSDVNGKASLYYVDDKANRIKGQMFSVGSGSTYAYGVLDSFYDWDMNLQDAIDLSIRAISSATYRDAGSGGVVRVYHVHDKGWTKIHDRIDVSQLHYKYNQSKGLRGDGKQVAPPFSE